MSFLNTLNKIVDPLGLVEGAYNKVTGRETKAEKQMRRQINEQAKAYKEQTQIARDELNKVKAQQDIEKRRINEKQIRSLRNNYRPRSLFAAANNEEGMSDQLGG